MAKFYSQHPNAFLDLPISDLMRIQRRTDDLVDTLEREARRDD